ncbi:MAG: sulfotransferase [Planctomycetia bacterium]
MSTRLSDLVNEPAAPTPPAAPLERLPTFLVVGAAKSGTTSLYEYLRVHPDAWMPAVKEPCFFCTWRLPEDEIRRRTFPARRESIVDRLDRYIDLFPADDVRTARGDASTHYLFQPTETAANLKAVYGSAAAHVKLVAVLRNPVEAAFSNYVMWWHEFHERPTFDAALDDEPRRLDERSFNVAYLSKFRYAEQLAAFDAAGLNVRVWLSDDLNAEPERTVSEIQEYVGLRRLRPENLTHRFHQAKGVRHRRLHRWLDADGWWRPAREAAAALAGPAVRRRLRGFLEHWNTRRRTLAPETRLRLIEAFAPDVERLGRRLGRNLDGWLETDGAQRRARSA